MIDHPQFAVITQCDCNRLHAHRDRLDGYGSLARHIKDLHGVVGGVDHIKTLAIRRQRHGPYVTRLEGYKVAGGRHGLVVAARVARITWITGVTWIAGVARITRIAAVP